MTCGLPQASIFRPLLWNTTFDKILKEEVPPGVTIICYSDDTLVVMAEDDIPMLEWKVNITLDQVSRTEPSNYKDRSGAVYTPLSVQSLLFPPKGGADKALHSPGCGLTGG